MPRLHSLGELLGVLARFLTEAGVEEAAAAVRDFAAERRRELWMLEEAYYRGRYGYVEYGEEEAKVCVRTAEEVPSARGEG